jgi:hypothetical protein
MLLFRQGAIAMRTILLAAAMFTSIAAAPASQPATTLAQPATTRAADVQDPPKIHRMHFGQLGRDGWYAARSTGSGFTISMPTKFNDITVSRHDADGMLVTTHMVASSEFTGAHYSASATSSAGFPLPPNAIGLYVETLSKLGEVRQKRSVRADGTDAMELEIKTEKTVARFRIAQRDNVIYKLTVEVTGQGIPPAEDAAAEKFFESFRFPIPEAINAPGSTA